MPETLPTRVVCNIHPWMLGYVLIRDNPYMAKTDATGKFTIKNLPVGKWQFQVWHERAGYLQNATIAGKDAGWKRGRFEIEIKAGENHLGEVKVPARVLLENR